MPAPPVNSARPIKSFGPLKPSPVHAALEVAQQLQARPRPGRPAAKEPPAPLQRAPLDQPSRVGNHRLGEFHRLECGVVSNLGAVIAPADVPQRSRRERAPGLLVKAL